MPPEALMYMMGLMEDVWRARFGPQWPQRPGAVKAWVEQLQKSAEK